MEPTDLMRRAIDICRQGIAAGQSPFGCAIARQGRLLACAHNTVLQTTDITAHAEMNAIRMGCREMNDIFLAGAVVATTCEPCPMCLAALHWARVDTIYFGASIADAAAAGFNELRMPAGELSRLGGSGLKVVPSLLADECRRLFIEWSDNTTRRVY
ncbi:MAG: nucleoside deaminase [Pirellulales bacterium]